MVRFDKNLKGSVNDTPVDKKRLLRAKNINALNDDINLPRGSLLTYICCRCRARTSRCWHCNSIFVVLLLFGARHSYGKRTSYFFTS